MKESDSELVQNFRAYLHLAITAEQMGKGKQFDSLGSKMTQYCVRLAELPANLLARELFGPVRAVIERISEIAGACEGTLRRKDAESVKLHSKARQVLNQLDLAYAFILRNFNVDVLIRSEVTEEMDLLTHSTSAAIGKGSHAARLVRRFQQAFPNDCRDNNGCVTEGGFPESFAWDTYLRVMELDRLVDDFPEHIRFAARQMHAWPMLVHRHTNNRRRFAQLAKLLELGAEYPTDASEGARFRPDTPLVRYITPLIQRLHSFHYNEAGRQFETTENQNECIRRSWRQWPEDFPDEELVQVLRATLELPVLNKATATNWAEKALVPLILATDARDWKNCKEPVLQRIAKQRGVKSRATFKSRLLAAVSATLKRLARPA